MSHAFFPPCIQTILPTELSLELKLAFMAHTTYIAPLYENISSSKGKREVSYNSPHPSSTAVQFREGLRVPMPVQDKPLSAGIFLILLQ